MIVVYLSIAALLFIAIVMSVYSWRRPAPEPAVARPGITLAELFEHRRRLWDTRTPLGELEAPTLTPWPEDEAAEMLAAWRDERAAAL